MSENKEESKKFSKWILFILILLIALLGFYIYNNFYYLSSNDQFTEKEISQQEEGEPSADNSTEENQNGNQTNQDNAKSTAEIEDNNEINGDNDNKIVESENDKTSLGNSDQEGVEQDLAKKSDGEETERVLQNGQNNEEKINEIDESEKTVRENNKSTEKSNIEDIKNNDQSSVVREGMIVRPKDLIDENRKKETGFGRQIYLLLIGQDQESDVKEGKIQSDSIILANIEAERNELNLIAISSHEEYQGQRLLKYNRNQLMNLMGDFIGIEPQYYFVINYEGFKEIVNLIGGIEIEIEESFEVPDLGLYLKEGTNLLSGQEALNYVRYHNPEEKQFSRIRRQQQVIESFTDKIFQKNTLLDIPKLYGTVVESIRNVETNFDYELAVETYGFIRNSNDFDVNYKVLETDKNN